MRAYSYLYQSSRSLPFYQRSPLIASYVPAIPPSEVRIEGAGPSLHAAVLQRSGDYCQYHRQ